MAYRRRRNLISKFPSHYFCIFVKDICGGDFFMFPFYWNTSTNSSPYGMMLSDMPGRDSTFDNLPPEVLEALEMRRHQISSQKDIKNIVNDLNMRK